MFQQRSGEAAGSIGLNPYVFIVGSPRSGTTLLRRVVDAHSQLAITPESEWIVRYYNQRIGLTPAGIITPELVPRLLEHPKFHRLGLSGPDLEELVETGGLVGYASFVSRLFDHYSRTQSKPLVGDKTPNYVRQIQVLHHLWPRAKFVHLIRDGRDVGLSLLGWKRKAARMVELFPTWEEAPVTTAALCWERNVRQGREQGRLLGPKSYYEIRYESFVTRPAEEVQGLCGFLGVPYESGLLEFHQGRTKAEPGLSPKEAWLPITPGLRDWKSQMPRAGLERFEAVAGDLLDELGYPRACAALPATVREETARLRDCFAQGLSIRAENLPAGTVALEGGVA
jgi:hypothetical protein